MYSEALSIMDRNTVKYMIDELKEELKQQQEENPVFDMTSFEDMLDDVLTEPVPDTAMVKPSGSKHKKGKK